MLKNKFEQLPFRDKLLLYLLVPIFFVLVFISLQKIYLSDDTVIVSQKQFNVQSLANKIVIKSNQEILDYIEIKIAQQKILVQSLTVTEQIISLSVQSSFDEIVKFLYVIEQHLVIEEFSLEKEISSILKMKSKIVLLNHYFANPIQKDSILKNSINPFEIKNITLSNERNNEMKPIKPLDVGAIVSNEVFIDGDWYTLGDIVHEYKIIFIGAKSVKLINQKTNKTTTIRLEDE